MNLLMCDCMAVPARLNTGMTRMPEKAFCHDMAHISFAQGLFRVCASITD